MKKAKEKGKKFVNRLRHPRRGSQQPEQAGPSQSPPPQAGPSQPSQQAGPSQSPPPEYSPGLEPQYSPGPEPDYTPPLPGYNWAHPSTTPQQQHVPSRPQQVVQNPGRSAIQQLQQFDEQRQQLEAQRQQPDIDAMLNEELSAPPANLESEQQQALPDSPTLGTADLSSSSASSADIG